MVFWGQFLIAVIVIVGLAYLYAPLWIWTLTFLLSLMALHIAGSLSLWVAFFLWAMFAILCIMNISAIRTFLLTGHAYKLFQKILPMISRTEQEAIDAGEVWWEAQLLQGRPHWENLLSLPKPSLTKEELHFLENNVETLCAMLDDWKITQHELDLSPVAWEYIKKNNFFGIIIPKEYGGLGFSALASSTIVQKIATRSLTAAVSIMVPNSLGPAELLLAYGTDPQKQQYLSKLASGEEIPCFALTAPDAGSDASNITDFGIVCRGIFEGKEIIGMKLTWNKRYITLAPIATVLGLAIKLYDPEGLLGSKRNLGITLCLIPTNYPGVVIGKRHFPLNQPFMNGPTLGTEVFVPLDWIIGGIEKAGCGWRMLVESLSAGRGISLPALSTAAGKGCYRATGAYAKIRKQFNTSIGRFEGVEEVLARIAGMTYLLESTRLLTLSAIDNNIRPVVGSAIAKYHMTEMSRQITIDAMDVHGGRGIMLGPKNYLARCYEGMPISITVEGANILTRNLIIYGQGLIRCHPYLRKEMEALWNKNTKQGIQDFDKALCQHIRYALSNLTRLLLHSFTGGWLLATPSNPAIQAGRRYIQKINRMSIALSFTSDLVLLCLGGKLKRSERVSARLGDILSNLYLASAVLKYFHDFGGGKQDVAHMTWAMDYCLYRSQVAFCNFIKNFNFPYIAAILKFMVFPWGYPFHLPKDQNEHRLASMMMTPSDFRDRLTAHCYLQSKDNSIAFLDKVLEKMWELEPLLSKVEHWHKEKHLHLKEPMDHSQRIELALREGIITNAEADSLKEFEEMRWSAIQVDEFTKEELLGR